MGAAHKGRNEMIQLFVERGAMLDMRDKGSRDTHNANNVIAGHQWIALDYADGLVRVGVQSANPHPETAKLDSQTDGRTRNVRATAKPRFQLHLYRGYLSGDESPSF